MERLAELQELLKSQAACFNQSTVGQTLDVLLERPGRHEGQLIGRSPYMQAVYVASGSESLGQIVSVKIEATSANSISGTIVADTSPTNPSAFAA